MKMMKKAARGFTLIELMIVVAIIGILAAIAIPNFLKYQLRTRRTEGSVNVAAIRTAQVAHFGNQDSFATTPLNPTAIPVAGKKNPWGRGSGFENWAQLGFEPEGDVYYQYRTVGDGASFNASAVADLDANLTEWSCWLFAKPTVAADGTMAMQGATAAMPANCVTGTMVDPDDPEGTVPVPVEFNKVYLASGEDKF